MTNHVHIAMQVSNIPLSRSLQNLSFRYTRWINWRENRTGHLFQGRYKAVLVDGDTYLFELVRYIHLNPVRAGMVKDPERYPWSGHRVYLGKEFIPWLTTSWMLSQFGKSVKQARSKYRTFVLDGLAETRRAEFYGSEEDSRVFGDDSFMDKCLSASREPLLRLTVKDIAEKVCLSYDIDAELLKNQTQQRVVSEARAVVGWLARELGCATLTDVGKHVNRDVGSISSAVRRLSERLQDRAELAERVLSLKAMLEKTT